MNRYFPILPVVLLIAAACDRATTVPPAPIPVVESSSSPTPVASASASASASMASLPAGATACGPLRCLHFETPEDAFRFVLSFQPLILAIGESHAKKDKAAVASAAKRFTDTLLPFLKDKASDLVVELMAPNPSCKKTTQQVKKSHEVVTQQQAPTAQNEYVLMGERARTLGVVPDLLRPSCEDLSAIQRAGDDPIAVTLSTIARLTIAHVEKLLRSASRKPEDADKMIVTYGGALHNDPSPSEDRALWSFGPDLSRISNGHYVALDLFVPEYMDDTESWRALPWFAHYDADRMGEKTTLFHLDDGSFVLIFPRSDL
ncbi:MAG TPA: hypothetical protein PLJ27_15755 [Polyangiaceae bacterium]|nr:hypothetical protein [Polyangiaceae bacterium]